MKLACQAKMGVSWPEKRASITIWSSAVSLILLGSLEFWNRPPTRMPKPMLIFLKSADASGAGAGGGGAGGTMTGGGSPVGVAGGPGTMVGTVAAGGGGGGAGGGGAGSAIAAGGGAAGGGGGGAGAGWAPALEGSHGETARMRQTANFVQRVPTLR